MSVQYGSALPSLMAFQRSCLSQVQRPGKNSFHGLRENMGYYDEITFTDMMDPADDPTFAVETTRERLEKQYGLA